jgi:O-antigen/teichoic acid export membrane protein
LPIAFVANALVARTLGVSDYGNLAFLTVTLGLALSFANFGFDAAFIQKGSRAEARGDRAEADRLLSRSLGFQLIAELPTVLIVAIVLTRGEPLWEVLALGTAVVMTCLFSGAALSLTIENRTAAGARVAMVSNLLVQAGIVIAALMTASASAVLAVRMLVAASALGLNFLLLSRARLKAALAPQLPRSLGRPFWRFALFTWAASIVTLLVFSRSEIFILQAFHQQEALGVFALAFGLSQQMTAPADALLLPLLPAVAGILSEWPERALLAFERSTRVTALVCGVIAAAVVPALVFAIPLIYGKDFATASWLLVPLALVSVFQSVNNPVVAFVNARRRAGLRLKATSTALVVDVAIAVALIPRFGAWGAVVANIIGQLIVITWLVAAEPLARSLGLSAVLRLYRPFLVGLAAAGAALSVGLASHSWSASLTPVLVFCVGGGVYVFGIRLCRSGLTTEDRNAFVGAMAAPLQSVLSRLLQPVTAPNAR